MLKTVTKTAKTVDEAVEAAIAELGCTKEEAQIEVISEGSEGGCLGVGKKDAEVKVSFDDGVEAESAVADAAAIMMKAAGNTIRLSMVYGSSIIMTE